MTPILNTIIDRLVKHYDPDKIILFGSRAYGQPTADSDYDICVVKADGAPRIRTQARLLQLLADLGLAIDIIALQPQAFDQLPSPNHIVYELVVRLDTPRVFHMI